MTEMQAAGPPCDICEQEPAVASLMNYADYSQMKLGTNCAPAFLRSVAAAISGEPEPEPATAAELAAELAAATPDPVGAVLDAQGAQGEQETGSAAEHWAATQKVVRSTHGHRTPRASSGGRPDREPDQ